MFETQKIRLHVGESVYRFEMCQSRNKLPCLLFAVAFLVLVCKSSFLVAVAEEIDTISLRYPGESKRAVKVSLNMEMQLLFGEDNPIVWAPKLEQPDLIPVDGAGEKIANDPRRVTLGWQSDQQDHDIEIVFDDRGLLSKDKTRGFTLQLRDPGKLMPGLYEGNLVTEFEAVRGNQPKVPAHWRIRLAVSGRCLSDLKFTSAAAPHVGRSASTSFCLETIDCVPGQGLVELISPSRGKEIVRIPLSFPSEEPANLTMGPIDARVVVASLTNDLIGTHTPPLWPEDWSEQPLEARLVPRPRLASSEKTFARYDTSITMPDFFEPGEWQARVTWQEQSSPLKASVLVGPGIYLDQKLVVKGEHLKIRVITLNNSGDSLELIVANRDGVTFGVPALKNALDEKSSGAFVAYDADIDTAIHCSQLGDYAVRVVNNPQLNEAVGENSFTVIFQATSNLEDPIILFRGGVPPWWDWQSKPGDGGSYEGTRSDAYTLSAPMDRCGKLHVQLCGVDGADGLLQDATWKREPRLSFPRNEVALAEPVGEQGASWPGDEQNQVRLNMRLAISKAENPPEGAFGERDYNMRLLITGQGENGTLARVVLVPYKVDITSRWEHIKPHLPLVGVVSLVGLGFAGWWVVSRFRTPRLARVAGVAPGVLQPTSNGVDPDTYQFSSKSAAANGSFGQPPKSQAVTMHESPLLPDDNFLGPGDPSLLPDD